MNNKTRLVQITTADDFILSGLFAEGDRNKEAIIFIHGFTTDFFSPKFIHVFADEIIKNGNALILGQNRGTGNEMEVFKANRKDAEYLGSFYEKLEDAHLDISAWIKFLKEQGYDKVILMGHSLGTIKAVRYLFEGEFKDSVAKLILLAPFDKNSYVEKKTKGEWHEHVKIAEQMIKEGKELKLIPRTFDDFDMSYRTYYSWYKEDELNSMWDFYRKNYDFPILNQINIPVKIIVGDNDAFLYEPDFNSQSEVENILKNKIKNLELTFIKDSEHVYVGFEDEVAREIISFL